MFIEKEKYFIIEEFQNFGIKAIYTKKNAGNMSDYCPIEGQKEGIQKINRQNLLKELNLENKHEVMAFQTHSNNIQLIDEKTDKYYYEKDLNIDGFITKRKDIAIFTFYADCLPIFVYDKKNKVIGVWHSGWPGTFKEIMKNGLQKMKEVFNTDEKDVLMGLGIGMQVKYYEVGNDFYDSFVNKFGIESELIKNSFKYNKKSKKYHFDNTKFNEIMALSLGIKPKNLIVSYEDTYGEINENGERNDKFHSHRREGKMSGRATAMISFL